MCWCVGVCVISCQTKVRNLVANSPCIITCNIKYRCPVNHASAFLWRMIFPVVVVDDDLNGVWLCRCVCWCVVGACVCMCVWEVVCMSLSKTARSADLDGSSRYSNANESDRMFRCLSFCCISKK